MDSQMHELRHYSILFIANELLLQFNLLLNYCYYSLTVNNTNDV